MKISKIYHRTKKGYLKRNPIRKGICKVCKEKTRVNIDNFCFYCHQNPKRRLKYSYN